MDDRKQKVGFVATAKYLGMGIDTKEESKNDEDLECICANPPQGMY